ncbi:MAG: TIGR03087 family PEP-CTERM/XrtA system glycosyltransferase, partial [Burkholderiaceae bacterium]
FHAVPLDPRSARLRSVTGFLTGEALTLPYYRSADLARWVQQTVAAQKIRKAVVFSGAMAQYVRDIPGLHVVLDFVDVDSAKWTQYAANHSWPASFVYRREGERLLRFERHASASSAVSVFVTQAEAELFIHLAPESAESVHVVEMGVDTDFFASDVQRPSPFDVDETAIVFTGAMDYWPNIDAAVWFSNDVLPLINRERPGIRFYVVGMNPSPVVKRLSSSSQVVVTGSVRDVRPYLQHASVVVAPLRVARGVQSKVLEAMSMGRPVVTSLAAARSVRGVLGRDLEAASDAEDYARRVIALMRSSAGETLGRAARAQVIAEYNWDRNLAKFGHLLDDFHPGPAAERVS